MIQEGVARGVGDEEDWNVGEGVAMGTRHLYQLEGGKEGGEWREEGGRDGGKEGGMEGRREGGERMREE